MSSDSVTAAADNLRTDEAGDSVEAARRWRICALLFLATTINYIDRQILALIKPILDEQIGWTDTQYGAINAAFQAAYALGLVGFGWFIDRHGPKIAYTVSISMWSLAALGHAFVGGLSSFFVARVWLGLGEAGNFPAAIKTVSIWFPQRERAFATSLFNSGCNVGAMLAPLVIPWITLGLGWRATFILAGLAGFLWLPFWIVYYRQPKLSASQSTVWQGVSESDKAGTDGRIPWRQLLRYRQTWALVIAKFLSDPVWWFFLIWLPDYFNETRHLHIQQSWRHLSTIYLIVTVLGIFGSWLSSFLGNLLGASITRTRKITMLVAAVCVLPIAGADACSDELVVLIIGLAGAAHQVWSANLYSTAADMFPKTAIASVTGLGGMAGAIGGLLFPIFCGVLLDSCKARGQGPAAYTILMTICACSYLVALLLNHLLAPRFCQFSLNSSQEKV